MTMSQRAWKEKIKNRRRKTTTRKIVIGTHKSNAKLGLINRKMNVNNIGISVCYPIYAAKINDMEHTWANFFHYVPSESATKQ